MTIFVGQNVTQLPPAVVAASQYSVLNFGAKGDGVTDDTAAIQAALNACATAGGGEVLLLGMSAISASLVVPNFVTVTGPNMPSWSDELSGTPSAGKPSSGMSGLKYTAASAKNFPLIVNSDTTNGNYSISLRRLRLDITGAAAAGADVANVDFTLCWRFSVVECFFYGDTTTSRLGLRIAGDSEEGLIWRNHFEGCGITLKDNPALIHVLANEVGQAGIKVTSGFGVEIAHNDLYCDGVAVGAGFASWPNGILLSKATETLVHHNSVVAYQNDGVVLNNTLRCKVDHNTVVNCSRQTAGTWGGIGIDSNSNFPTTDNQIIHNTCYDRQVTKTQGFGIRGNSFFAAQTTGTLIESNVVRTNRNAGMSLSANFLAAANNVVRNNPGWNPVGSVAPPTFPATTVAATPSSTYDVTIFITNGTSAITQIAIGGTNTNMQIAVSGWAAMRVPAGQTIAFSYGGGTPAWTMMAE